MDASGVVVSSTNGFTCSVYDDLDAWHAVCRFVAEGLDKHCFRAAQSLSWSQIACCMASEGLLCESDDMTPQVLAALSEDERPPEHRELFVEMHAIRCLQGCCGRSSVVVHSYLSRLAHVVVHFPRCIYLVFDVITDLPLEVRRLKR